CSYNCGKHLAPDIVNVPNISTSLKFVNCQKIYDEHGKVALNFKIDSRSSSGGSPIYGSRIFLMASEVSIS
ncbi:8918_t:CDS:1, partial [Funneliformis geosporum]